MFLVALGVLAGGALAARFVFGHFTRRREHGIGDPDFWKRDLAAMCDIDVVDDDAQFPPRQLELELAGTHPAT